MFKNNTKWNTLEKDKLQDRKWFIFKWEVLIVLGLAFLAALLNQIPNWVVKPLPDGSIDPVLSYPLLNNITYTTISIVLTVGVSIFIGVFTEVGKFAGKYGSALFILVPSFVWLLSDRSDNRVEEIIETAVFLGKIIFWTMIGILGMFALLFILRLILHRTLSSTRQKIKMEFAISYIDRFMMIITNILIVLMLGYSLINYGILSLHLADITPAMHKADPNLKGLTHNLHSEGFITYIAVIAIFFALLMVLIGLSNIFTKNITTEESKDEAKTQNIKLETTEENLLIVDKTYIERGPNG